MRLVAGTLWVALMVATSGAGALELEVTGYVGVHQPVDQDDATDDVFAGGGVLVPIGLGFRLDPQVSYIDMDRGPYRTRSVTQEVQTWHMISTGLNLTWVAPTAAQSVHPYLTAGAGMYFLRKYETPDATRPGVEGGVGLLVEMKPDISLDIRTGASRVSLEQGGARGLVWLRAGVVYHVDAE